MPWRGIRICLPTATTAAAFAQLDLAQLVAGQALVRSGDGLAATAGATRAAAARTASGLQPSARRARASGRRPRRPRRSAQGRASSRPAPGAIRRHRPVLLRRPVDRVDRFPVVPLRLGRGRRERRTVRARPWHEALGQSAHHGFGVRARSRPAVVRAAGLEHGCCGCVAGHGIRSRVQRLARGEVRRARGSGGGSFQGQGFGHRRVRTRARLGAFGYDAGGSRRRPSPPRPRTPAVPPARAATPVLASFRDAVLALAGRVVRDTEVVAARVHHRGQPPERLERHHMIEAEQRHQHQAQPGRAHRRRDGTGSRAPRR